MPVCIAGARMNGSMRMPKPDDMSMSPITGLRTGTAASVRVSRSTWARARLDAVDLVLEGPAVVLASARRRNERAADRRAALTLAGVEAEIGQHAADAPRLGLVAFFDRGQRRRLPRLDAIERRLQARERARRCAVAPRSRARAAAGSRTCR